MNKSVLADIPKGEYVMVETDLFPKYAERGLLHCYLGDYMDDYYWMDIGTHERYNQANEDFKKNKIIIE
jgi:NDP-sugar pyrophosphorylase family protein